MLATFLVLLLCATSVLLIRLRIRAMRLARLELRRREALRVTASIDALTQHYEQFAVRLTCDVAPAIEGIAKAFTAFSDVAQQSARRFAAAFGGDADDAIERAIRNAPRDE